MRRNGRQRGRKSYVAEDREREMRRKIEGEGGTRGR